jgi:hypothetical protein
MVIYFHHIPRTSGTAIRDSIVTKLRGSDIPFLVLDSMTPITEDIFEGKKFITGHLANYPNSKVTDLQTFTLVRNPVEQFISYFKMFYSHGFSKHYQQMLFDRWLSGHNRFEPFYNMQSKSITGSIDVEMWNLTDREDKKRLGWLYNDYNFDKDLLSNIAMQKLVFTFDNRDNAIKEIDSLLDSSLGFKALERNIKMNDTPGLLFEVTDEMKDRIRELNHVDMFLYNQILAKEGI